MQQKARRMDTRTDARTHNPNALCPSKLGGITSRVWHIFVFGQKSEKMAGGVYVLFRVSLEPACSAKEARKASNFCI